MSQRLPLVPTLLVGAAVAIMIALGIWQIGRADTKAELLKRYAQAAEQPGEVSFPTSPAEIERGLYHRSSLICERVLALEAIAGRSATDQSGWAHLARCGVSGGGEAVIALGWSDEPSSPAWSGGFVTGIVAPAGKGVRLVAEPAEAGLAQLTRPDPQDLPNNHISYAIQWFFFAGTALVIYVLALRRRRQRS